MNQKEKRELWNYWNNLRDNKEKVIVEWLRRYSFDFIFEELVINEKDKQKRDELVDKLKNISNRIFEEQNKDIEIKNLAKRAWEVYQTTNWTQLPDARLSQEGRKLYREYRNYLLDIEKLWRNKQLKDFKVMTFEEWRKDPPIYKLEKEDIL